MTAESVVHQYLSTGCLHGNHAYCASTTTTTAVAKVPAKCKFCEARCVCVCHRQEPDDD